MYPSLALVLTLASGPAWAAGGASYLAGPLFSAKFDHGVVPLAGLSLDTDAFRWMNYFEFSVGGEMLFPSKVPAEFEGKGLVARLHHLENAWGMVNPGYFMVLNVCTQRGKFIRNLEKECLTCPSEEYASETFFSPGIGVQATPALKLFRHVAVGALVRAELNTAGFEAYTGLLLGYRR